MVAAEIAKIHTTEWTTQLLYDEPLYRGMNANWHGLFRGHESSSARSANHHRPRDLEGREDRDVVVLGPRVRAGIFGLAVLESRDAGALEPRQSGARQRRSQSLRLAVQFPRGVHHGVPPAPAGAGPHRVPAAGTRSQPGGKGAGRRDFRGRATHAMRGRARELGAQHGPATARGADATNHPLFLQNLDLPRPQASRQDRRRRARSHSRPGRGVPRFNEFRRQYGLRQLTSFDDFVDHALAKDSPERAAGALVGPLREVYGQHRCDASKVITDAQVNADGTASPIASAIPTAARRQRRGRRYRGRLAGRVDAAPRLRDLRDPVPGVHPQCIAAPVQRPLLHVNFRPEFYTHSASSG